MQSGQPLVVLCPELSEAETAACAELVPQHGLRLVHLQAGELDRDPALAREQLRRLLNVESQPAPTGAGERRAIAAHRAGSRSWSWRCALGGSPAAAVFTLLGREGPVQIDPAPLAGFVSVAAIAAVMLSLVARVVGI